MTIKLVTDMCRTYGAQNAFASRPSPHGLGYVVSRLRRLGFVEVDLESFGGNPPLIIGNSSLRTSDSDLQQSAGGAEDCSPVRERWVHGTARSQAP